MYMHARDQTHVQDFAVQHRSSLCLHHLWSQGTHRVFHSSRSPSFSWASFWQHQSCCKSKGRCMRLGSTLWFLDVFGVFGMIKLAFDLLNLSSCVFLRMNGPEPSCCELKRKQRQCASHLTWKTWKTWSTVVMAFVHLCSARSTLEGQGDFGSFAAQGHRCDGLWREGAGHPTQLDTLGQVHVQGQTA